LRHRTLSAAAAAALAAAAWAAVDPAHGGAATFLAALAVIAAAVAWVERDPGSAQDLTLVATLAGLAAAGRVLFAPVPGVQPVTVIVAAAGVALGPRRGFAVGALAAIVSNMFLGQGPHTPWQMLAWGGCGAAAGLARPLLERRVAFAAFTFVLGFAYGGLTDLWHWYTFWPHTSAALGVVLGAGFTFNAAHAIGNVVLALVAGPELRRVLTRHERRRRTEVVWA
jgi:energy-coupling factor transport system substrate-specific component